MEFRRLDKVMEIFFKLIKNAFFSRDKTISERKSETAVVAARSFFQKLAKEHQCF